MSELKRITGLWLKDGKAGKFMSGKVTEEVTIPAGHSVLIFKNTKKERDGEPDYILHHGPPRQQQGGQSGEF